VQDDLAVGEDVAAVRHLQRQVDVPGSQEGQEFLDFAADVAAADLRVEKDEQPVPASEVDVLLHGLGVHVEQV